VYDILECVTLTSLFGSCLGSTLKLESTLRVGQAAAWHSFEQNNTSKQPTHFQNPVPLQPALAQHFPVPR
jgi:hypothetical protein